MVKNPASNRGFSGSHNLTLIVAMVTKILEKKMRYNAECMSYGQGKNLAS